MAVVVYTLKILQSLLRKFYEDTFIKMIEIFIQERIKANKKMGIRLVSGISYNSMRC